MRTLASYREAFRVAFRSVTSSKLRSFLTLLGVILATTTLIVVMSLVHGMDVYVAETVSDMGTSAKATRSIRCFGYDLCREDEFGSAMSAFLPSMVLHVRLRCSQDAMHMTE